MPKMKTKSSAKKRFTTTASGKIKYYKMNKRHILTKKSRKLKRTARKSQILQNDKQSKALRTLIGA